MIFEHLLSLAQRLKLGTQRLERKDHMEIVLDDAGTILAVRAGPTEFMRPDLPNRNNSDLRIDFYIEPLMYARGIPSPKKEDQERATERALAAAQAAAAAYTKIAEESKHRGARAVARYYEKLIAGKHRFQPDWFSETYAFVHKDLRLCECEELMPWLSRLIDSSLEVEERMRPCMITGIETHCQTSPHPNTKGLSGHPTGSSLVSFNGSSQYAHRYNDSKKGFNRFLNAPMDPAASRAWSSALSWLSRQRCLRLGKNLSILLWFEDDHHPLATLWATALRDADMAKRLEAADAILRADDWLSDETVGHVMTVAGNVGRLAIVDWFDTTVGTLASNLRQYLKRYRVNWSNDKGDHAALFAFDEIAKAWLPPKREIRSTDYYKTVKAILKGESLPTETIPYLLPKETTFLQATILKNIAERDPMTTTPFSKHIDVADQSAAFRLGRAAHVMEMLQERLGLANKNPGTFKYGNTVRMLTRSPASVFAQLNARMSHHVERLLRSPELRRSAELLTGDISSLLAGVVLPERFGRADRNLCWSGFHYERARRRWVHLNREQEPNAPSEPSRDEGAPIEAAGTPPEISYGTYKGSELLS